MKLSYAKSVYEYGSFLEISTLTNHLPVSLDIETITIAKLLIIYLSDYWKQNLTHIGVKLK